MMHLTMIAQMGIFTIPSAKSPVQLDSNSGMILSIQKIQLNVPKSQVMVDGTRLHGNLIIVFQIVIQTAHKITDLRCSHVS